jgi:NADPH-dependent 2,4-dienoyl-CoA reductase/sulfur reductase-like enzyme
MNGHAETRRAVRRLQRREFLGWSGLAAGGTWYPALVAAAESSGLAASAGDELTTDVLIVGGGLGGCAAALAATRAGVPSLGLFDSQPRIG